MNVIQHTANRFTRLTLKTKAALLCVLLLLILFCWMLPDKLFIAPTSYVIEDANGNLLNASIAADGQWRFPYNADVPEKFIDCITTFEDKRFFKHPGIDVAAIARASIANFSKRQIIQGGSTITMQVIRMAKKNNERSIWNKLKESLFALRLEMSCSKKEILGLYASNAPFGSNVVGLDAAAWRYFGRTAKKLSWAEMATLAVLPNAPSLVHPGKNREELIKKRNRLLDKLAADGKITPETASLSKLESLPEKPIPLPQQAPHLLQRFKKEINGTDLSTKIKTTLDGRLQQQVTALLQQQHQQLKGNGINNICALVLDVETGNTLSYVGNIYDPSNKELESHVDVISAPRSPGSVLKPILYAAMLSDGMILPNTLIADIPTDIAGYIPQNFNLEYDGAVPAGHAIARSLNIPAVRLLQQYRYQRFYETLNNCGITTLKKPADHYGLSLILGGCEINMWELAGLYASFARMLNHQQKNKGIIDTRDFHPPLFYKKEEPKTEQRNISIDATSVYFTFRAMQDVMRPGEEGLWQQFTSAQKISWKTGTSFGFRDGWAIGVTPANVVAVWVGNTDGEGRPGLIGVNTAAPVMFNIFRLLPTVNWFAKPAYNYVHIPVCRQTGFRANIDCKDIDTLFMPPNAGKSALCPYHKIIHLDPTQKFQVTENCVSPGNMVHKSWFILPPAMEFYYKQHNHDYIPLPDYMTGCSVNEYSRPMEIIYPQPAAKIYVPLEINGERGKAIFTAMHRKKNSKIFWSLDDQFIGSTEGFHQLALSPVAGKHVITLTDQYGTAVSREFEIIVKK